MYSISNQVADIRNRIALAAQRSGRQRDSVCLIAVSKTRGSDAIRAAANAGIADIGENYLDESIPKIEALHDVPLHWHFIGAVQSNKTRDIARHFQWVQTLDREKIAHRLSAQRPADAVPLDVLIQVNIDQEPRKSGIVPQALAKFSAQLRNLPRLRVRGLMAIPRPHADPEAQRQAFRRMRILFDDAKPSNALHWDTLSMGMSQDFEIAIEEGATMIRIGTAIFGPRTTATTDD